jgi:NADH:ubiquinone oxidoreductase subunit E
MIASVYERNEIEIYKVAVFYNLFPMKTKRKTGLTKTIIQFLQVHLKSKGYVRERDKKRRQKVSHKTYEKRRAKGSNYAAYFCKEKRTIRL